MYEATIKTDSITKKYIGSAETTFKQRWYGHKSSFKYKQKQNETSLSKYIWELKEANKSFDIKWQILKSVPSYDKETKKCQLCLVEKTLILYANKKLLLNKRSEIMNKCRHRAKFKLSKY